MIVEITSLTPRFTFNTPAIAAKAPPMTIATMNMNGTCNTAGRLTSAPSAAVSSAAIRY